MTDKERIAEILKKYTKKHGIMASVVILEEYAEELVNNGVIVPPCKVGDKIYQLDTAGDIYESEITQIVYNTKGIAFDERAIGKTVFLTKEDAEEKLKELKSSE